VTCEYKFGNVPAPSEVIMHTILLSCESYQLFKKERRIIKEMQKKVSFSK
jgi:hypothetical protein